MRSMSVGFFQDLFTGFVSLVYPPHCLACRSSLASDAQDWFCSNCRVGLPENRSVPSDIHPLAWARAACAYEGLAKRCVLLLKYGGRQGLAQPMARRMVQSLKISGGAVLDLLVPVPLYSTRLRQRQFNQAGLLAHAVGRQMRLPVSSGNLIRHAASRIQSALSARERRGNVQNVFSVRRPEEIAGRKIALIDDVLTTGSTAKACAQALLKAGAQSVGTLAFAGGGETIASGRLAFAHG
ncbi:MAG: ComF family protein [Candidatus Omnitrophica bacterium]|nr:ComF family protein [Candidatus Omnitrophota bacterium]